VVLDKVVRVAEEAAIEKDSVQDTKRVSGTVRKKRVIVDVAGDVTTRAQDAKQQDSNVAS
jgi:stress response protein YsnF